MRTNTRIRARVRRRRIIRRLVLTVMMLATLLTLLFCVIKIRQIYQNNDGIRWSQGDAGEDYLVKEPQKIDDSEIADRLLVLSEEYPEVKKIREEMSEYPTVLLKSLCNNPEMLEFVKGYLTSDGSVTGGLTDSELEEEIPLLLQWDKRWGYAAFGDSNIGLAGCAPTCLSMVVVGLTKNEKATPDVLADYAMEAGYYIEGTGTSWGVMTDGVTAFGVAGREIPLDKNIIYTELEAGHPVICSVRPGDFTTEGHFIVLTGIRNGKITVNDPNSRGRSRELWDYENLAPQIKNLWAFSVK